MDELFEQLGSSESSQIQGNEGMSINENCQLFEVRYEKINLNDENMTPNLTTKVNKHAKEHEGYTIIKMLSEDKGGFEQEVQSQNGQKLKRKVLFLKNLGEASK